MKAEELFKKMFPNDVGGAVIYDRCLDFAEAYHKAKVEMEIKSLPPDNEVYHMAANYIKRNGIIDKPQLRDEVFNAYKYGCYWMRKQLLKQ